MKISNGLKQVIFKKLYEDLSNVEIIPHKDSFWFIDRQNEFWYFEYEKSGTLWWRYFFFKSFFDLFSLESAEFQPIISEWVEEVLNCKVETTGNADNTSDLKVEEVLNYKVETTVHEGIQQNRKVEEVLNCKVEKTVGYPLETPVVVEEVLKYKVESTFLEYPNIKDSVEEVLNFPFEL